MTVLARKKDESLVKTAVDNATKQFHEISGRDVKVSVESSLADDRYVQKCHSPNSHTHLIEYDLKRRRSQAHQRQ